LALQAIATVLAWVFLAYGFLLGLAAAYGGHLLILVILGYVVLHQGWARLFRLACELLYGLLNPLIYLVVLRYWPARFEGEFWSAIPLHTFAWALLVLTWGMRLTGSPWKDSQQFRTIRRTIVLAGTVCVVLYGIKDAGAYSVATWRGAVPPGNGQTFSRIWMLSGIAPLYLIPLLFLGDYLRRDTDGVSDFLLLRESSSRVVAAVIGGVAIVTLIVALWRPSDGTARQEVLSHKSEILEAASEYRVDPAAIASILYVTQRYQITPLRRQIEGLAMALWLKDSRSDFVGTALDVSLGLSQIKPGTAQTASQLVALSGKTNPYAWAKEYRNVPRLEWSLPSELTQRVTIPWGGAAPKADVVAALLDDRDNLRACAMILAVYQLQWATVAPSAMISSRPDILATLFQIGFERSHPKASPRNNAFGRQVQAVYDSEWMRAAFR
jgi:hypothetical protein